MWLLGLLLIPCWVIAAKFDIDLVVLHHTATLAHHDLGHIYGPNGSLGQYFYGPISLVLFYPLGWFPYVVVKWFWIVLQTIAYLVFWVGLYRLYPKLNDPKFHFGWLVVWIISINPIHNNFQSNNIQLMLAAVFLVSEFLTRHPSSRRQFLGGLICVIAGAVKIFPLFLAAFYFVTKKKAVRGGIIAGAVLSLITPLIFFGLQNGIDLFRAFYVSLTTYEAHNSLLRASDILCLPSLLTRWFGEGPLVASVTKAVILGLSGTFFVAAWWLKKTKEISDTDLFAMALLLMALLNPSTRPHYFIFYVPAFCSIVVSLAGVRANWVLAIGTVVATLLIAFTAQGVVGKQWNNIMEGWSLPTYGMLLLAAMTTYLLRPTERQLRSG